MCQALYWVLGRHRSLPRTEDRAVALKDFTPHVMIPVDMPNLVTPWGSPGERHHRYFHHLAEGTEGQRR